MGQRNTTADVTLVDDRQSRLRPRSRPTSPLRHTPPWHHNHCDTLPTWLQCCAIMAVRPSRLRPPENNNARWAQPRQPGYQHRLNRLNLSHPRKAYQGNRRTGSHIGNNINDLLAGPAQIPPSQYGKKDSLCRRRLRNATKPASVHGKRWAYLERDKTLPYRLKRSD